MTATNIRSGDDGAQTEFDEGVISDVGGGFEQLLEDRVIAKEQLDELLADAEITGAKTRFDVLDEQCKAKAKQLELPEGAHRCGRHKIMVAHQKAGNRSFDVKESTRVRIGLWND